MKYHETNRQIPILVGTAFGNVNVVTTNRNGKSQTIATYTEIGGYKKIH